MNNIIVKDNGDAIGFYTDLTRENKTNAKQFIDENNWEEAETCIEIQRELDNYYDDDGLLVISENNGMGWNVKKYKGEE